MLSLCFLLMSLPPSICPFFFFNDTATTEIYTLSLHDALPIFRDPDSGVVYPVRHLYIHSSALAQHEAKRREAEMSLIEAEVKRIQGLVNKYDYKSPEVIVRRVQQKAFKQRRASRYFDIEVVEDASCPQAPYALTYRIDQARVARDAALDGVYF